MMKLERAALTHGIDIRGSGRKAVEHSSLIAVVKLCFQLSIITNSDPKCFSKVIKRVEALSSELVSNS